MRPVSYLPEVSSSDFLAPERFVPFSSPLLMGQSAFDDVFLAQFQPVLLVCTPRLMNPSLSILQLLPPLSESRKVRHLQAPVTVSYTEGNHSCSFVLHGRLSRDLRERGSESFTLQRAQLSCVVNRCLVFFDDDPRSLDSLDHHPRAGFGLPD